MIDDLKKQYECRYIELLETKSRILKESQKALQEDLKETLRKHEENLQKALDLLES